METNPNIATHTSQLPTFKNIIAQGNQYSVIDLRYKYLQMEVGKVLGIAIHDGFYK